jgi:hypothetical protein
MKWDMWLRFGIQARQKGKHEMRGTDSFNGAGLDYLFALVLLAS